MYRPKSKRLPEIGARINEQVLLDQVPAAGANEQRRDSLVETVFLAVFGRQPDGALDRFEEVELARHHVRPGGGVGVLEVRHEG